MEMEMEMEIGNGNWKRNWKLEMVVKYSCYNQARSINTTCIEYSEVALSSSTSSISMYVEKLGGPEDETSTQLTSN